MDKELKVGKPITFDHLESEPSSPSSTSVTTEASPAGKKSGKNFAGTMRIILILMSIVALCAVSGAVALYVMKEEEITKRVNVEKKLQETQETKQQIENKLQKAELEIAQKITDIEQSREQYRAALKQLTDKEAEHKELQSMFDQKMNEIFTLKADYEKKAKDAKSLEVKLERINTEYEDIKVQLGHIRMAKEALENRIIQMSKKARPAKGVDLEEVVVTSPGGALSMTQLPPPARLEGQVLVVNKEFAFVVINLGERDGLKETNVLEVFRGTQFMGKVKVERIYDTMSSAVLIPDVTVGEIKEGDIVKLI